MRGQDLTGSEAAESDLNLESKNQQQSTNKKNTKTATQHQKKKAPNSIKATTQQLRLRMGNPPSSTTLSSKNNQLRARSTATGQLTTSPSMQEQILRTKLGFVMRTKLDLESNLLLETAANNARRLKSDLGFFLCLGFVD
ncbi:hypothetical protein Droror1_Dr00018088 [Drosera rotundifolia]